MDPALNPYAPGAGTRPPVLTGRDAEIDAFRVALARLAAGRPARSIVLSGLRGVGKTVLLNEFDVIGREAGWVTSDVVECNEDDTLGELMARLSWRALRRLSRGRRLSGDVRRALGVLKAFTLTADSQGRWAFNLDVDALSGTADSGDLEHDIVELLDAVGRAATAKASGMLILLDELQFLGRDDLRRLAGAFHRMSQEEHPVLMAAAGLPQLPLALAQAKPYSERLFTYLEVGSLRPAAARAALLTPATRAGVRFSDAALRRVIDASSGYPYFLQQWGEAVWNEAVGAEITMVDVGVAADFVNEVLDRRFFRDRYEKATEAERIYMAAMADLGDDPRPSAAIAGHMGRTLAQLSVARDSLIKKGLIYNPRDTLLDFTVPHFAAFLRRVHPFDPSERPRRGRSRRN